MSKPEISYFDRDTVAVADHDHRLLTPKQALTRAAELVAVAREAQRMTPQEIRAGYDALQRQMREEFPEQFADLCTCPMSVRATGRHAVGCPRYEWPVRGQARSR